MNKIFWLVILGIIIFFAAYALVPGAKPAIDGFVLSVGGSVAEALYGFAGTVALNPIYQQYHPLIWLIAGAVGFIALHQLWQRRPAMLQRSKIAQVKTMNMSREPAEPEPPQKTEEPIPEK